jgi:hypothetical protein
MATQAISTDRSASRPRRLSITRWLGEILLSMLVIG